jgi:hypothetical protein
MKIIIDSHFGNKNFQNYNIYLDKDLENKVKLSPTQIERITEVFRISNYNNLVKGQSYTGEPVAPLKQSTINKKGHSGVFFESGELFQSVRKQVVFGEGQVYIAHTRRNIASWLFEGRKGKNPMKPRKFFGISNEALKAIDKILLETK